MKKAKTTVIEYLIMTAATLIMSAGIYFFKFPNGFCMGGVSGISMILGKVAPQFSASTFMLIINVVTAYRRYARFRRRFGLKTVYCSLLLSLSLSGLELLVPRSAP